MRNYYELIQSQPKMVPTYDDVRLADVGGGGGEVVHQQLILLSRQKSVQVQVQTFKLRQSWVLVHLGEMFTLRVVLVVIMTFPLISSPGRKVLDNLSSLISMLVEDMTDTQLLSNNFQSEEERSLSVLTTRLERL